MNKNEQLPAGYSIDYSWEEGDTDEYYYLYRDLFGPNFKVLDEGYDYQRLIDVAVEDARKMQPKK